MGTFVVKCHAGTASYFTTSGTTCMDTGKSWPRDQKLNRHQNRENTVKQRAVHPLDPPCKW
eukprot:596450-Amphidinium_carterae.1